MYRYAQLNNDNTVIAISELHSKVDYPHMIPIDDRPNVQLQWQYIDGKWHEPWPGAEQTL